MPKEYIKFATDDISSLAKSLKKEFDAANGKLSHVEILNVLARASGHKNFQQMRAKSEISNEANSVQFVEVDKATQNLNKLKRYLNSRRQVIKLPSKLSQQELVVWYVWSFLDDDREFNEIELNRELDKFHTFGDAALLRRFMVDAKMMQRSRDCKDYQKLKCDIPFEFGQIVEFGEKLKKAMAQN